MSISSSELPNICQAELLCLDNLLADERGTLSDIGATGSCPSADAAIFHTCMGSLRRRDVL
jgi:hypothetical protein